MTAPAAALRFRGFLAAFAVASAGCGGDGGSGRAVPDTPTFNRDVAPILHQRCASCHRPGGIAPFSLLTYDDARAVAARVAEVTAARLMPPWLPEPGYVELQSDPSLSDAEIEILRRWAATGATEGGRTSASAAPRFEAGWQLGEPDLIVEMPEAYTMPADTTEVFRNFVVPLPVSATRYVRAVEFRGESEPAGPSGHSGHHSNMPVHHAVLMVDATTSSRRMDAQDPEPGYEGMFSVSEAQAPNGFFLGWTPGKRPHEDAADMAWRLDPGTDLVLQLHFMPTGRREAVTAKVGFHFTDRAPAHFPMLLRLGSQVIDVAAGDSAYAIEDSYVLPVDVDVLGVYPHAHYLAKEMHGWATLPDGSRRWLIRIRDWDFNWQDAFRYVTPMSLPQGSVLHMRYTYDNSAENPQNPHSPPRRVQYGPSSRDEMGDLWIQVLTRDSLERVALEKDFTPKAVRALMEGVRFATRIDPQDPQAQFRLASTLHNLRELPEAIVEYRRALALHADYPAAHNQLAKALLETGRMMEAVRHLRRAIELDPEYPYPHYNLANALAEQGDRAAAEAHYRRAIELRPDYTEALYNLGNLLQAEGRIADAAAHYQRAVDSNPAFVPARFNLANLFAARGRWNEAIGHYRAALTASPGFTDARINYGIALEAVGLPLDAIEQYRTALAHDSGSAIASYNLGNALGSVDDLPGAIGAFRRAVTLRPEYAQAHYAFGRALYVAGEVAAALEHLRSSARLEPRAAEPRLALAWVLATNPDPRVLEPGEAVRLAGNGAALLGRPHPVALATLAAAQAAAGQYEQAVARGREGMDLAIAAGDGALAQRIAQQIDVYRQGRPYRADPRRGLNP